MKELGKTLPYLKRQKNLLPWLHPDILKPYKQTKFYKDFMVKPPEYEFQIEDEEYSPNVLLWKGKCTEEFTDRHDRLTPGGLCFIFDADPEDVLQWRRENKLSPQIHVLEPPEGSDKFIWFWNKPAPLVERVRASAATQLPDIPLPGGGDLKTFQKLLPPKEGENHLTQDLLNKYVPDAGSYPLIFIETGTYFGQGVQAAITCGKFGGLIYSIELDKDLAERARELYGDQADIRHGDSPDQLDKIHEELNAIYGEGAWTGVYWLDAHASGPLPGGKYGGTPVVEELKAIKRSGKVPEVIMIDDCRLFGSMEWSGVKREDAIDIIKEIDSSYKISYEDGEIECDILVAHH